MQFRYPYDPASGAPGDGSIPWTNGNPAQGLDGSIPPAEAFNDPQREVCAVIDHYLGDGTEGSGQNAGDLTQLLQAVQKASSGLQNLPIHASVVGNGGRVQIDGAGTGDREVATGQELIWRGHRIFTTDDMTASDRTINVPAGTHHLRWSPNGGFVLQSLADNTYNPSGLGDGSSAFDSEFDDVLLGRFEEGTWAPSILRQRTRYRFEFSGTGQLLLPLGYRDREFRMNLVLRNTVSQGNVQIPNSGTSEMGYILMRLAGGSSGLISSEYGSVSNIELTTNNVVGEFSFTSVRGTQLGAIWDIQGHQSEHSTQTAEGDEQLLMQARRTVSNAEYLTGVPLDYTSIDEGVLDLEVING